MDREATGVIETCVGFARALRAGGIAAGRTEDFVTALSTLNPMRNVDVYWAGRATLCSSPEDLPEFDRLFNEWFGEQRESRADDETFVISSVPTLAGGDDAEEDSDEEDVVYAATRAERLRRRDLETLSANELKQLTQLYESLAVTLPKRRTRRSDRWRRGELDVRRIAREQLRTCGELGALRYRRSRMRNRRVVFLIDVSKSMTPYADHLLRLAHRVRREGLASVEVFTIGTRLTRVTRAFDTPDPERALQRAGEVIPDWFGGTRIADGLGAFIDRWGRAGMARQAVVVIASDGWERGDTAALAMRAEQLGRLAHRVIWMNPQSGKPGYEPVQAGITAVLPHIDQMVAGHSLVAFNRLLEVVSDV